MLVFLSRGRQICKNTASIGSCPIPRKYREKKIPSLLTSDCRLQTGSMATTKKEPPSNKEVCLLFLQNKTTGNFEFTNSSGGKCFSKGQSGICPGCKTVLVYRNGYSNLKSIQTSAELFCQKRAIKAI